MFGLFGPGRRMLLQAHRDLCRALICAACLSSRVEVRQFRRAALNCDALILSLLAEHLRGPLGHVRAGGCPLRGRWTLHAQRAAGEGNLQRASVSAAFATGKCHESTWPGGMAA